MKDRVPGAPGQYKAVVTEAELQKMQTGEQFTITMTRDDQPIVEGTPYSKAAVLPDSLAALLCPSIADPSPADAFQALNDRYKKHLLWQNASAASDQPEQGINLGDISQYAEFIICADSGLVHVKSGDWHTLILTNMWSGGWHLISRKVSVGIIDGIGRLTIGDCYLVYDGATPVLSNNRLKLHAVYGIKGVDE